MLILQNIIYILENVKIVKQIVCRVHRRPNVVNAKTITHGYNNL